MSTAKHTAGPWIADAYGVVTGGENGLTSICETYAHAWAKSQANLPIDKEETSAWLDGLYVAAMANAKLIAAAPELLEACKAMVEAFTAGTAEQHTCRLAAIAAIAKAEGKA